MIILADTKKTVKNSPLFAPPEKEKPALSVLAGIGFQWFASAEEEGRTEEPSEHKLQKAREEGRVPKSQEITGALVLLLPAITLVITAPWLFKNCVQIVRFYFEKCQTSNIRDPALLAAFYSYFIKMLLPLFLTAIIAGVAGNMIQTKGFLFSTKPIEPKFSKILPKFGEYFKKTLFSFEGAFNIVKSIGKVTIIVIVAYMIISSELKNLLAMSNVNMWQGVVFVAKLTAKLLLIAAAIFLVISVPDYLVQRRQFMESMKMTKQEVKEEYKELEGDPLVKSRLRRRMNEMLRQSMPKMVAEADVVITNPTHFACAIKYDKATMQGPVLNAKGADSLAQRIKAIARENDVPIVENRPLARAIYAEVEVGQMIPEQYYQTLAVILAKVYSMDAKKSKNPV
ncbi:MAG: flagellar biosynthesis protein FlhB [Spirochaetaceae bacterium]|nr:flagellar biosynthesis protein FlhB [Spirochaetaceae bacterium]